MSIRGFLDESEQGNTFILAGWVSDRATWERFSEDWYAAIREAPAIEYFKHHEAKGEPPTGQFAGWPRKHINAKMNQLVDIICAHEMYGVISGLDLSIYEAAYSESIAHRKQLRSAMKNIHPYNVCVFSMSALVLQIQIDRKCRETVDLIFDEMTGLFDECKDTYNDFKQRPDFPLDKKAIAGAFSQANDKDEVPLQAADLLAGLETTSQRLKYVGGYYTRLRKAHKIYVSPAYFPSFDGIPELIRLFNVAWSTKTLSDIARRRVASSGQVKP